MRLGGNVCFRSLVLVNVGRERERGVKILDMCFYDVTDPKTWSDVGVRD